MATLTYNNSKKVTVTLPTALIKRLDTFIPSRQRSRFVTLAIQEQLALLEQMAALEESAGSWTEEAHPEMKTPDDIEQWLQDLRKGWAA
ncbi:hypothetical protein MNBD_CHLOROFLEXI01-770 [hydrothermal vent metagenome]|uniref:Uncharacterized protein n=1 Tax=hydrothermal vent metagenome TaxID=652676 RepID=A0A3B0UPX6_9ZZZZ